MNQGLCDEKPTLTARAILRSMEKSKRSRKGKIRNERRKNSLKKGRNRARKQGGKTNEGQEWNADCCVIYHTEQLQLCFIETRQVMYVQHKIKTRSRNDRCRGKEISITPSECAPVASVTQQAMRMHRIVLLSAACPAVPHFSTLSHTRHDFKKNY